jgi:hypothetical protein
MVFNIVALQLIEKDTTSSTIQICRGDAQDAHIAQYESLLSDDTFSF